MEKMSDYMVTAAFGILAIAALLYIWHIATKNKDVGLSATMITYIGGACLTLGLIMRSIVTGHGPFANMYEYSVSFAWGIVVCYLFFERQLKTRSLSVLLIPIAWLLLLYANSLPAEVEPLNPALQNNLLLTVHVSVAIFAYGVFAVSFGSAVMYLMQEGGSRISWMPDPATLDDLSYKSVIIGVPLFALVIILGAVWGNVAWGRYWGWDPKETASLVTWLIYLGYLHSRSVSGWKGRTSATMLVVGFVATLFTFFGVNLFLSGLHSYAGL